MRRDTDAGHAATDHVARAKRVAGDDGRGPNSEGAHAAALPSGGFFLSSSTATYRID